MGRPRKYIYHNKDYTFRVKQGDIFKETADVMVVPAFTKVDPKFGLEKIVYEKAGKEALIKERKRHPNGGELKICGLLETSAQNLKNVKRLFHIVPPANRTHDFELLEKCYENCIELASTKQYESIIFPLIGAKNMMFSNIDAYRAAKNGIERALSAIKGKKPIVTLVVCDEKVTNCIKHFIDGKTTIYCSFEMTGDKEEYATRMQDMLNTFKNKDAALDIYKTVQRDRKAFKQGFKNPANNRYAANVMQEIIDDWIQKQIVDKNINVNKSIAILSGLTQIGETTLKDIYNPQKKGDNTYRKHDRMIKIQLAVAMKLDLEKRTRFIIADEGESPYPYNDFEDNLELVLAELGDSADYQTVEKALKEKGFSLTQDFKIKGRSKHHKHNDR